MPVGVGKSVKFANEEVRFALGIPDMKYPIPAGIIEMSELKYYTMQKKMYLSAAILIN